NTLARPVATLFYNCDNIFHCQKCQSRAVQVAEVT
ncbi:MAG: hypothetical protein ACI9G5_001914, partial [Paracoccaceae bacterium]